MVNLRVIVLQTGQETDFVLVSCSGLGIEPSRREQVLKAKRVGLIYLFCFFYLVEICYFFFIFLVISDHVNVEFSRPVRTP